MFTSRSQPPAGILVLLAAGLSGCSIPTSAPEIEQRWVVAAPADSISLADVLPPSVTVQGGEFRVDPISGSVDALLGALCGACAALQGTTALLPAFQGSTQLAVGFPASVVSVRLGTSDTLSVALTNALGFDPLQPSPGAPGPGSLVLTIADSTGAIVAALTPSGNLPDQATTTYRVALPAGRLVPGPLTVTLALGVPGFGPIAVPANPHLTMVASSAVLGAQSATVVVASHAIDVTTGTFNIDALSSSDRENILAGALHLSVQNPFGIAGTATVHFERAGVDAVPSQNVLLTGAGSDELSIAFDAPTMQTLLTGGDLKLHLTASVSGTGQAQTIVVSPVDRIDLTPRLAFTTRIGG